MKNLSVVFREGDQAVRILVACALEENDVLITEGAQTDEPRRAAIAELIADLGFGVVLKDDYGGLVLRKSARGVQDLVVGDRSGGGGLNEPAHATVQGVNDEGGAVRTMIGLGRYRGGAGRQENGQGQQGRQYEFFYVFHFNYYYVVKVFHLLLKRDNAIPVPPF